MRILLAAEGLSDEVVARRLIERYVDQVEIDPKKLSKRGLPAIQRLASDFVRAGYFGYYDLLVVHFDMDDTLADGSTHPSESDRWRAIKSTVDSTLDHLRRSPRPGGRVKVVLMTPKQATEAWLSWARDNESGRKREGMDRRALKRELFGNPPRSVVTEVQTLAISLIDQMQENDDWPVTLKWFVDDLIGASSCAIGDSSIVQR